VPAPEPAPVPTLRLATRTGPGSVAGATICGVSCRPQSRHPATDSRCRLRFIGMKTYWVYILARRRRGTLYTGITSNIGARVHQHKEGRSAFTAKYRIHRLVYAEPHSDVEIAIRREKTIKRWRRQWKYALIEGQNPDWRDLYHDLHL
jgi:putative endonuclease